MKSELELMKFYNIEFGKTYRIFNSNDEDCFHLVGKTFSVERASTEGINCKFNNGTKWALNVLNNYDYKEVESGSLLTPKEKEYLTNVINPFKDRVLSISKFSNMLGISEAIAIHVEPEKALSAYFSSEPIYLPYFKTGTMYKKLIVGIQYTPKELGL